MAGPSLGGPLRGLRVLTLAVNVPGPVAASRLRELGAEVTKVEPPGGDPLEEVSPGWYRALASGQTVIRLDLKETGDRARLEELLGESDLLLTSSRHASLRRLGLDWPGLHTRHPRLSRVAIVGHPAPREDVPGHDLTYQAGLGLLDPPNLPRTLLADLSGAERAVSAALAFLLVRERGGEAKDAEVSLAEAAASLAEPLRHGPTAPGGAFGGGDPGYDLYRASDGWVAVAVLEPRFRDGFLDELGLEMADQETLAGAFLTRTAGEWESWAAEHGLPLAAVREAPPAPDAE